MKSISITLSMILSMVSSGDLALELLPPAEERLRVCCLVRESERVLNQGARSSRQLMARMVSRGSPATMGRGGTDLPSWNIKRSMTQPDQQCISLYLVLQ